jgi:flagellar biosynthesis GTPase FlhF
MNIKQILQATDLPNFLNSNHLQKGVEYYIRAAIGITQINDVVFQIAPHLLPSSIIFYNGNDPNGDLPEQARANLFGAIWIPSNEISPNITNIATEYFLFKESLLEDRAQMEEMHRKWQKKVRQIEITKEKLEEEQKKNEAFKKQLENEEAKRREEEQKSEKLKKQLEEEEKKSKELRKQLELEEAKRLEEERRCNEFKLKYEELQKRLAIEEERKKEVKRRKKEKKGEKRK